MPQVGISQLSSLGLWGYQRLKMMCPGSCMPSKLYATALPSSALIPEDVAPSLFDRISPHHLVHWDPSTHKVGNIVPCDTSYSVDIATSVATYESPTHLYKCAALQVSRNDSLFLFSGAQWPDTVTIQRLFWSINGLASVGRHEFHHCGSCLPLGSPCPELSTGGGLSTKYYRVLKCSHPSSEIPINTSMGHCSLYL